MLLDRNTFPMSDKRKESNQSRYYLGEFEEAIIVLAIHPGDVRERLVAAWGHFILAKLCIPKHLIPEYERIILELTKRRQEDGLKILANYCSIDSYASWNFCNHGKDKGCGLIRLEPEENYGRLLHTTRTMRRRTGSRLASCMVDLFYQVKSHSE